jgi:hypothetical protein
VLRIVAGLLFVVLAVVWVAESFEPETAARDKPTARVNPNDNKSETGFIAFHMSQHLPAES